MSDLAYMAQMARITLRWNGPWAPVTGPRVTCSNEVVPMPRLHGAPNNLTKRTWPRVIWYYLVRHESPQGWVTPVYRARFSRLTFMAIEPSFMCCLGFSVPHCNHESCLLPYTRWRDMDQSSTLVQYAAECQVDRMFEPYGPIIVASFLVHVIEIW